MPNEIKAPKILKETIKQVYEFMKAESLLLEFDRKTILRLIIEALSTEEVNALITAGKSGNKKLFRKIMRQYHPDRNKDNPEAEESFKQANDLKDFFIDNADVNKKNFENPEVWPDSIKNIFQKTQQDRGNQQDQGGEQEASPEVKQTVQQLARKFVDKYSKLQSAFSQTLFVFRKKPEKFFESPAFIDELLKAANKLNEDVTLDPEMSKALGLEAGKDRENIQKIIAGLEKIRKEVIEALSKKEQLVKERPKCEEELAG
jgi:hypothetical protein